MPLLKTGTQYLTRHLYTVVLPIHKQGFWDEKLHFDSSAIAMYLYNKFSLKYIENKFNLIRQNFVWKKSLKLN